MKQAMKLVVVLVASLAAATASAQSLQVQKPVPYSEDGDIADNIKQECKLDEQLADYIAEYARENGIEVQFSDGPVDKSAPRALDVRITNALSMGNAWIGHQKGTTVAGALYENGEKVASFKARRHSMGGAFAGYKGSCSVLGRTVKAIGSDIASWLKAPTDGANLGD